MTDLKKISFDVKTGIIFGIVALVFSFLTGLFSGIGLKSVLFRTFFMVLIFLVLGFAVVFVLKRFVPEFYEFLSGAFSGSEAVKERGESSPASARPPGEGAAEETYGRDGGMESGEETGGAGEEGGEFSELTEKNFPRYETISDNDLEPSVNVSHGKMGKHIIEKEKIAKYEPKLMAEAIRTMMGRDQE